MRYRILLTSALAANVAGCAVIPDLPSESEMPVQEILNHAVCELRQAFRDLRSNPNFKSEEWAISISLNPKRDTEFSARFGMTGKSTVKSTAVHYLTWTFGTAPGVEFDAKGHREGSVAFPIHSSQLLDEKRYPLSCLPERPLDPPFTQHLGIGEWLQRLIPEKGSGVDLLTNMDKPTYSTELTIKTDAGVSGATFYARYLTYNASGYASNGDDRMLSIAFTRDPKKEPVQTLPIGATYQKGDGKRAAPVSAAALQRLDQIQTEAILRNLRVAPQ